MAAEKTKNKPAQKRYVADKRSETNKARSIAKSNAWQSACAKARAKFGAGRDMGRRVRKLRRGDAA